MLKLLIVFGGKSSEHEISCKSAGNILTYIDKSKYDIELLGIDKQGNFIKYLGNEEPIKSNVWLEDLKNHVQIDNVVKHLKKFDLIFPILHGSYGEDGTIQGMLELLDIPFVGCDLRTSAAAIDKHISKVLASSIDVPIVPYQVLRKGEKFNLELDFPLIVKPNSSGSSCGVTKITDSSQLEKAFEEAFKYDNKVLIEKYIPAREFECAVLGNKDYLVSEIGEISSGNELYDYEAKYTLPTSVCRVPAEFEFDYVIKEYAKKISELLGVRGLSRIDFFVDKSNNDIYFNEINTMPGFTNISMYPKLIEHSGISYTDLIDKLIELATK